MKDADHKELGYWKKWVVIEVTEDRKTAPRSFMMDNQETNIPLTEEGVARDRFTENINQVMEMIKEYDMNGW